MSAGAGRIVLYAAASLDGRIADASGGVDWLLPFQEAGDYGLSRFMAGVSCVVAGRATYDQARGFGEWPYGGKRLVLLSSREVADLPRPATRHAGRVEGLLPALRREPGEVWLLGGTQVFAQFLGVGAVDRIEMFLMPVLLGAGPALLPAGEGAFRLLEQECFPNGVVRLAYAPIAG